MTLIIAILIAAVIVTRNIIPSLLLAVFFLYLALAEVL